MSSEAFDELTNGLDGPHALASSKKAFLDCENMGEIKRQYWSLDSSAHFSRRLRAMRVLPTCLELTST
jgi:hypothetical protein